MKPLCSLMCLAAVALAGCGQQIPTEPYVPPLNNEESTSSIRVSGTVSVETSPVGEVIVTGVNAPNRGTMIAISGAEKVFAVHNVSFLRVESTTEPVSVYKSTYVKAESGATVYAYGCTHVVAMPGSTVYVFACEKLTALPKSTVHISSCTTVDAADTANLVKIEGVPNLKTSKTKDPSEESTEDPNEAPNEDRTSG